jgi:hypothetical protein
MSSALRPARPVATRQPLASSPNSRSATIPTASPRVRWKDAGVDTLAVNTLRFGRRWPHEHLDALLRAADILQA